MSDETPKPGSDEAIERGCLCAQWDNRYGRGFILSGQWVWVVNQDCPLHGVRKEGDDDG